jgi:hypothetical protein
MTTYPSAAKPEDLDKLLKMLPKSPVPAGKVSAGYFKNLGFSLSSGKSLLSVLKVIGFINDSDEAAELWKSYASNEKRASILAQAIKNTYSGLFTLTVCPYLESDEEIFNLVKKDSGATSKAVLQMLLTFHVLCELADFQDLLSPEQSSGPLPSPIEGDIKVKINPNLQLTIQIHIDPQTPDEKIEAIFRNMRKYLLGKNDG